jgi:hypothetical protein
VNARTLARVAGYFAVGFSATAILWVMWGSVLGGLWPYLFEAPWPSIGKNASASMVRARVFDASFGATAGAFAALALSAALKRSLATPIASFTIGAFVYGAVEASESVNALADFIETPMPSFISAFLLAGCFIHLRRRAKAQNEA